ncbi:unnamed protein product [Urochloa humidicola]
MATTTAAPGLAVAATDPIRSFLTSAAASDDLDADLRELASALSSGPDVPYRTLRAVWCATSPDARPPLRSLLQGADFVLPSPKPREKSDELKARLEKLRDTPSSSGTSRRQAGTTALSPSRPTRIRSDSVCMLLL